jgi:hypothetical protein
MSLFATIIRVARDVLTLTDEVRHHNETLDKLSSELRDQDRRITRLEAAWDTAIVLSSTFRRIRGPG